MKLLLECDCKKIDHYIRIEQSPFEASEGGPLVRLYITLNNDQSFWSRLCNGLRFIFRAKQICSDDSTLLNEDKINELITFLHKCKES